MCIIAVANQKGGTGKTTTCVNLGIGLARAGKKVLLVDADAQGSMAVSLGVREPDNLDHTIVNIMEKVINDEDIADNEGIMHHEEGVDFIPANIELAGLETALVGVMSREFVLKSYLDNIKDKYDYILIDLPEFLQPERAAEVTIPTPDQMATQERISTPRGSFCVTNMTREQMEAAGYGVHHQSDDGKYLIMGNGTRAFAVLAQQPEQDNPLRTAEMTLEDDYGMIDGVINNGRRGEELEKAQEYADRTTPEKPSIRERLEDAKRECAEHKPPEGKKPGRDVPEHDCL